MQHRFWSLGLAGIVTCAGGLFIASLVLLTSKTHANQPSASQPTLAMAHEKSSSHPSYPTLSSGIYRGGLQLGINPASGILTGYFETSTGWDETTQAPLFHCAFLIYGTPTVESGELKGYEVVALLDDGSEIGAQLTIIDARTITLQLETLPPGGMACGYLTDEGGTEFSLETVGNWTAVQTVATEQASFYQIPWQEPTDPTPVGLGTALRIYDSHQDFVLAVDPTTQSAGWILATELLGKVALVNSDCGDQSCDQLFQTLQRQHPEEPLTCLPSQSLLIEPISQNGHQWVKLTCWDIAKQGNERYGSSLITLPLPGAEPHFPLVAWPEDETAQVLLAQYEEDVKQLQADCTTRAGGYGGGGINVLVNEEAAEVQVQCYFSVSILLDSDGDYQSDGEVSISLVDEILGTFPLL